MGHVPLEKLRGYFNPTEQSLIATGQELPVGRRITNALCLKRVGTTVLNGLIAESSLPIAVEPSLIAHIPHPEFPDPNEVMEAAVGTLRTAAVNDTWQIELRVYVPLDPNELSNDAFLNPEPWKNGIRDPRGVMAATVELAPTDAASEKVDSDYLVSPDQEAYYRNRLIFTRVHPDFEWESRVSHIPETEQTELMLLLGKVAALELSYPT